MSSAVLLVNVAFAVVHGSEEELIFSRTYSKGDEVSQDDLKHWPAGALANRLNGGDVEWSSREEAPPAAPAPKTPKPKAGLELP